MSVLRYMVCRGLYHLRRIVRTGIGDRAMKKNKKKAKIRRKKASKKKAGKMLAMLVPLVLTLVSVAQAIQPHVGLQATQRTAQARIGLDVSPRVTCGLAVEAATAADWWRWEGTDSLGVGPYVQVLPLRPLDWLEAQPYVELAWPIAVDRTKGSTIQAGVGLMWDVTPRLAAVIGYRRSTVFGDLKGVLGEDRDDLVIGLDWRF